MPLHHFHCTTTFVEFVKCPLLHTRVLNRFESIVHSVFICFSVWTCSAHLCRQNIPTESQKKPRKQSATFMHFANVSMCNYANIHHKEASVSVRVNINILFFNTISFALLQQWGQRSQMDTAVFWQWVKNLNLNSVFWIKFSFISIITSDPSRQILYNPYAWTWRRVNIFVKKQMHFLWVLKDLLLCKENT